MGARHRGTDASAGASWEPQRAMEERSQESDAPALARDPGVLGGQAVFPGTRIPAWIMLDYLGTGATLDTFLEQYPSLTRDQTLRALDTVRAEWSRPHPVPPLAGTE